VFAHQTFPVLTSNFSITSNWHAKEHYWGIKAIEPEEMTSEMKAKINIIFMMMFNLKNRKEENL
jgi:hypothetical protein